MLNEQDGTAIMGMYDVQMRHIEPEYHNVSGVLYCAVLAVIDAAIEETTEPETTKNEHQIAPISSMFGSDGKFIELPVNESQGLFKALIEASTKPHHGTVAQDILVTELGDAHAMQLARWKGERPSGAILTAMEEGMDAQRGTNLFPEESDDQNPSHVFSAEVSPRAAVAIASSHHATIAGLKLFREHAFIRSQYSQLLEGGEMAQLPVRPTMSATERGINETELLTFTDFTSDELYRSNRIQELATMLEAHKQELPNFTGTLTAGHGDEGSILKRRYFRPLSALAFAQALAAERLREPHVIKKYYPLTDNLLYALHWPPPNRRMQRSVWETYTAPFIENTAAAVSAEASMAESVGSSKSKKSKASKASTKKTRKGGKGDLRVGDEDDKQPQPLYCGMDGVTLTPAGDSIALVKRFLPPPSPATPAASRPGSSGGSGLVDDAEHDENGGGDAGAAAAAGGDGSVAMSRNASTTSVGPSRGPSLPWMSAYIAGSVLGLRVEPYTAGTNAAATNVNSDGNLEGESGMHESSSATSIKSGQSSKSGKGSKRRGKSDNDGDRAAVPAPTPQLNGVFFCHTEDDIRFSAYAGPCPEVITKPDGLGTCCLTAAFPDGLAVTLCSTGIIKYTIPLPQSTAAATAAAAASASAIGSVVTDGSTLQPHTTPVAAIPPLEASVAGSSAEAGAGEAVGEVVMQQESLAEQMYDPQAVEEEEVATKAQSVAAQAAAVTGIEYTRYLGAGGTILKLHKLPSDMKRHLPVKKEILEPSGSRTLLLDSDGMTLAFHYYQRRHRHKKFTPIDFQGLMDVNTLLLEYAPENCTSIVLGHDGCVLYYSTAAAPISIADAAGAAHSSGEIEHADGDDDGAAGDGELGFEADDDDGGVGVGAADEAKRTDEATPTKHNMSSSSGAEAIVVTAHPVLHMNMIRSSIQDAETHSVVTTYQDGRMIINHVDKRRETMFIDGTSIVTHATGSTVSIFKHGLPTMEMDVEVDEVSRNHARGAEVPINKGGERVRARVALPDGSAAMIKYDTKLTTITNGTLKLVRRDKTTIIVKDDGVATYLPKSLWDAKAAADFAKECEDGEVDPTAAECMSNVVLNNSANDNELTAARCAVHFPDATVTTEAVVHGEGSSVLMLDANKESIAAAATAVAASSSSKKSERSQSNSTKSGHSASGDGGDGADAAAVNVDKLPLQTPDSGRLGSSRQGSSRKPSARETPDGGDVRTPKSSGRLTGRSDNQDNGPMKGILKNPSNLSDIPEGKETRGVSAEEEMEQDATFTFNFGKLSCRILDREYNSFDIDFSGTADPLVPAVSLSGEVAGLKPSAVTDKPMEPRLFVVDRSGEATELLSNHDVKNLHNSLKLYPAGDIVETETALVTPNFTQSASDATLRSIYFRRRFLGSRCCDGYDFLSLFGQRTWFPSERRVPAAALLAIRTNPFMQDVVREETLRAPPRLYEVLSIEERPPKTTEELQSVTSAISRCEEFREARLRSLDRFAVEEDRSAEELEQTEALAKRLKLAYKAAKVSVAKRKEQREKERKRLSSIASVGSVEPGSDDDNSQANLSKDSKQSAGKKDAAAVAGGGSLITTSALLRKGSVIPEGNEDEEEEDDTAGEDAYDPTADDEDERPELSAEEREIKDCFEDFAVLHTTTQPWSGASDAEYLLRRPDLQDSLVRLLNHHISIPDIDRYIEHCEEFDHNMKDFTYAEFRALVNSITRQEREEQAIAAVRDGGELSLSMLGAPSEDSLGTYATHATFASSTKSPVYWQSKGGRKDMHLIPPAAPPLDLRKLDWEDKGNNNNDNIPASIPEEDYAEVPMNARRGSTEYKSNNVVFYNNTNRIPSQDAEQANKHLQHAATVGGIYPYPLASQPGSSDSLENPEFDPNLPTSSSKYPAGSAFAAARLASGGAEAPNNRMIGSAPK